MKNYNNLIGKKVKVGDSVGVLVDYTDKNTVIQTEYGIFVKDSVEVERYTEGEDAGGNRGVTKYDLKAVSDISGNEIEGDIYYYDGYLMSSEELTEYLGMTPATVEELDEIEDTWGEKPTPEELKNILFFPELEENDGRFCYNTPENIKEFLGEIAEKISEDDLDRFQEI